MRTTLVIASMAAYTFAMTTLTVEVDEAVLARAEAVLATRESSVGELISETLNRVATASEPEDESKLSFREFLKTLPKYDTGGPFTRDEFNER